MSKATTHAYRAAAQPGADVTNFAIGGTVTRAKAAGALLIGDVVYISGVDTVNKSAVAATVAAGFIGVVVGGKTTTDDLVEAAARVGSTAASAANDLVYVQTDGIAYVRCTAAAVAIGVTVIPSGTAGQVVAGAVAGQMLGTAIDAGNASNIRIKIGQR